MSLRMPVAQRREQQPSKLWVEGSNPSRHAFFLLRPFPLFIRLLYALYHKDYALYDEKRSCMRLCIKGRPLTCHAFKETQSIAQFGSVSVLGTEGRRFKSCYSEKRTHTSS